MADLVVLAAWHRGAEYFNQGAFWEAHHQWEFGWLSLPQPLKDHIQGMIQVCGVLIHLQNGKLGPAKKLCISSQSHLRPGQNLFIQNIDDFLKNLEEALGQKDFNPSHWLSLTAQLKACVIKTTRESQQ